MKPVFIISLPRSGSTLLQRIIATSDRFATSSEPWFLLYFSKITLDKSLSSNVYTLTNYSASNLDLALTDFLGDETNDILRELIQKMYSQKAKSSSRENAQFFLDKTPRYYLIIDFIKTLFPDAKVIFLVRDIESVALSIFNTWYGGKTFLYHHYIDVSLGPKLIAEALGKYSNESLVVSYHDLLASPHCVVKDIENYLGMDDGEIRLEEGVGEMISGPMGDPTGQKKYTKLKKPGEKRIYRSYMQYWYVRKIVHKSKMYNHVFQVGGGGIERVIKSTLKNELQDALLISISAVSRLFMSIVFRVFYKIDLMRYGGKLS